jgi:hypothetical protein
LWACRRACGRVWGLGPRVVHWLYVCHQAVHYLCIFSMVAWLSDSQLQEQAKQGSKMSLLKHKRRSAHHSYSGYGGAHLPPPFGVGGEGSG